MYKNYSTLAFILFLFSLNIAKAQTTYVPDNNFEQALIDQGYDDVLDDYVLTSNISNIVELKISGLGISELTGIQDFENLQSLDCKDNAIRNLDMSQNKQLKSLRCHYNAIQSLNISGNPELEILNCRNNQIRDLNVSINTRLKVLNCLNNQITDLDIGQNIALTTLYCNNNQITDLTLSKNNMLQLLNCKNNKLLTLNVQNGANVLITDFDATGNPSLECIIVDNADDANAGIPPYDDWNKDDTVTYCENEAKTYVPDDNFEQALIDLGYDDVLDDYVLTSNIYKVNTLIIQNKGIEDLTGIEKFTSLVNLYIDDNQLVSLDMTQNTDLYALHIGNNQLTNLNVSQNNTLGRLYCQNNQLTSLDLSKNNRLYLLDFQNNKLTSLNLKSGSNTNITNFYGTGNPDLACIDVDDADWATINWTNVDPWTSFSEDCENASFTYVPDDNFEQALIDLGYDDVLDNYVLTSNISNIIEIKIANHGIADLTGIENFTSLEELWCANNLLISLSLSENKNLTTLYCHGNRLISLDLTQNTKLDELNFFGNQLTSVDLTQNTKLDHLNCHDNLLTDLNLSKNVILRELQCSDNPQITSINLKSGNNINLKEFWVLNNPNLACIEVDDADWATINWTNIDPWTYFSEDCENEAKTYVPDDNFEQALINLGYDDVLDDYVLTSNISDIIKLNIEKQGIADLTGIEGFISLEELYCNNNQLVSLSLNQNKSLWELYCSYNQLVSLDLTQNTDLLGLSCDNNQLTNLNVTQNTVLDYLNCSNTPLTSLDLSKNGVLFFLICRSTQLSSLNLKSGGNTNLREMYSINNPDLACIDVDDEDWANSQPEENFWYVDDHTIFANDCNNDGKTNIPDNNFEQALIDLGHDDVLDGAVVTSNITGIKELDVNNRNISNLSGIQDFKSLRSLICNDNQLTGLDLSQNVELRNLRCYKNKITNLDLTKNKALRTFSCRNNQLTSLDVSQNSELTNLRCNDNKLTTLDLINNSKLEILISRNNELISLNVRNGANVLITDFDATGNPSLDCIIVDNAVDANAGISPYDNWEKDNTTTYCTDEDRTYVPDDSFEGYLITHGYDDVLDDYVLTANINTITSLYFCNADPEGSDECEAWYYGIQDLTGIEDFESLVSFGIWFGGNINLDIDFSGNPNLELVNLMEGDVRTLNLSKNFKLRDLYVWHSSLIELDLSKNVNLKTLGIDDCFWLQKLNVKNGNNTSITSFSSTQSSSLNCIQVDNAAWSTANWTAIDPWTSFSEDCENTGFTYITDNNFEQALIDLGHDDVLDGYVLTSNITGIKELDVNNRNISNLSGIQDFKSLRSLICNDNQLTGLDLSQNIELRNLRCQENQLTSLDLSKNKALLYLSCRNNQITVLDLSQNTALTLLRCNKNELTVLDLRENSKLKLLVCSHNKLVSLNVKNGANSLITDFNATRNPNLNCIQVDNANDAIAGIAPYDNWYIDALATYSEDCNYNTQAKTAIKMEDTILSNAIAIYPNPVGDHLNIDPGLLKLNKVEVYTILGQKVKEVNSSLNAIELNNLSSGIYLIRLYSNKGITVRKIIKTE